MNRKKRARAGRPPKAPEAKRSYRATVRLTPEQYRRLIEEAEKAGVTLSTYIVSRLEV
jgi:predicted HicB family RNase H-like nuclease